MIKFNEKELEYIKESCIKVQEMLKGENNIVIDDGNFTKDYLESIGEDTINNVKKILENEDIFKNANINKKYNKMLVDTIYWIDGLWVWVDSYFTTAEEMAEYIDVPESCSIFEKIMNEETENNKETENQKGVWKMLSQLTNGYKG
ncbi:serine kinase [Clostridium botulinum]|nr:serine kinase [Clostridium botulinum]